MKKKNINIHMGDILGLISLISLIFMPSINFKAKTYLENMAIIFFITYLAYLFSHMPKAKVLYFIIPLVINSIIIFYVFNGASFLNNKEVLKDILVVIRENFSLVGIALVFYLIERFSTRLFGAYFTMFLASLLFLAYLVMYYTNSLSKFENYKDYILYLTLFLVFSVGDYKKNFKSYFYIISLLLIGIEGYFFVKKGFFLGFFLSPLLLILLGFMADKNFAKINFEKHFIFAIVFIFPMVFIIMEHFLTIRPFALNLASLIISFFVTVILSELKIKLINYIFLGIE